MGMTQEIDLAGYHGHENFTMNSLKFKRQKHAQEILGCFCQ